jgi:hypothetical protein
MRCPRCGKNREPQWFRRDGQEFRWCFRCRETEAVRSARRWATRVRTAPTPRPAPTFVHASIADHPRAYRPKIACDTTRDHYDAVHAYAVEHQLATDPNPRRTWCAVHEHRTDAGICWSCFDVLERFQGTLLVARRPSAYVAPEPPDAVSPRGWGNAQRGIPRRFGAACAPAADPIDSFFPGLSE